MAATRSSGSTLWKRELRMKISWMPKQLVLEKEKKGGKKTAGEEVLCAKGFSQRRQGELKKLKTICVVVAQRERPDISTKWAWRSNLEPDPL